MLSDERKSRSVTFGQNGTFLRLSYNHEETSYGIHSHLYVQKMLARDNRYGSMGCIIVSEDILDVLQETFRVNGDRLDVVTRFGLGTENIDYAVLKGVVGEW